VKEQSMPPSVMSQRLDPLTSIDKVIAAFPHVLKQTEKWQIKQLAGDASSRKYFRVSDKKDAQHWVLQSSEPFKIEEQQKHAFLSGQALLARVGVAVPKILGTFPEQGWVLLEDLGDETLQNKQQFELYESAVKMIVNWTVEIYPGSQRISDLELVAPHFAWAFDYEKLQAEMKHTAEHLVKGYLQQDANKFLTLVEHNSQFLHSRPRFFCHRDFHSRNLMLRDKNLYEIKFQYARLGPITYDLVSLLWDPYVRMDFE